MSLKHNDRCRICKATDLAKFLTLGPMPLANGFLRENQLSLPESSYPLDVYFCGNCGLAQLLDIVDKETLFQEYPYFSSVSRPFVQHCEDLAREVVERFVRSREALVVEIGSNDGVLLKPLKRQDVKTLGIEPASNVAKVAQAEGIETISDFFSKALAAQIVQDKGKAAVILASNVINHIDDLDEVMRGIDTLMSEEGVFIFEVPYLVDLINNMAFDTIYHEMHSYFTVRPLIELLGRFDMEIFETKRIDLHGGSIRVYIRRSRSQRNDGNTATDLVALERDMRLDRLETFLDFAAKVENVRVRLVELLADLKAAEKRIVGYGAPAKGNVLLNYCKIGRETVEYIVDATPYKQGLYTPGMHIPVYPVERFRRDKPDYSLLLPWNFAREILGKEKQYTDRGGRFIIPIPEPKIV